LFFFFVFLKEGRCGGRACLSGSFSTGADYFKNIMEVDHLGSRFERHGAMMMERG